MDHQLSVTKSAFTTNWLNSHNCYAMLTRNVNNTQTHNNRFTAQPVPEETLTHPPSWSSSNPYQLLPSTTIHSILLVQITCLAIFLHNLFPCPLWFTSWSGAFHLIFHTFLGMLSSLIIRTLNKTFKFVFWPFDIRLLTVLCQMPWFIFGYTRVNCWQQCLWLRDKSITLLI